MPDPTLPGWIIPVGKAALSERKEIATQWQKIEAWLLGRKTSIAITGIPGAGKTVLFDYLTGKGFNQGYKPPPPSQKQETGKKKHDSKRMAFVVVPGQDSRPRYESLDTLFNEDCSVDGVIHVVAYGYSKHERQSEENALVARGVDSIDKRRNQELLEELADLKATCERIRFSLRGKKRKPSWMLVAVTKTDLFRANLSDAAMRYSPHGSGPFVDYMKSFEHQVGTDNFRWGTSPVCTWLEDFKWNDETLPSLIKVPERDQMVSAFLQEMGAYCE